MEWVEDVTCRCAHREPYLSWNNFQKTRDTGWNQPFFSYALLFACTSVLLASYGLNGWRVEPSKINPMIGPSAQTLITMPWGPSRHPSLLTRGSGTASSVPWCCTPASSTISST